MKKTLYYLSLLVGMLLVVGSCSDDDDDNDLPKIDGYNNSDEVASENLLAHWTFDNTNDEDISETSPDNTYGTVGFRDDGVLDEALQLDSGAIVYPTIANINEEDALNNFTVSMWVQVDNTKYESGYFTTFFALAPSDASDIWPDIFMGAETGRHTPSSDTLELKILLNTHPDGLPKDQEDNIAQPNPNAGTPDSGTGAWFYKDGWTHFVATWNATTHKFYLYGNGVQVGGYSTRADTGVEILDVPVQAIFGSFPSSDIGFASAPETQSWGPLATASIDDVRIFNTALDPAEVTALYNLGVAGR